MDENDVDGCEGVVVYAGYFETFYLVEGGFGSLGEESACALQTTISIGSCTWIYEMLCHEALRRKVGRAGNNLPYLDAGTRHHAALDLWLRNLPKSSAIYTEVRSAVKVPPDDPVRASICSDR